MIQLFIIATIFYLVSAYVSYAPNIKASPYYYIIGIFLAIVLNTLWLTIAKRTIDNSKLLLYGLYWDSIITFTFLLVPFLFFHIKLTPIQYTGIILIISGIICTKLGS